jgi:hypothetical protein
VNLRKQACAFHARSPIRTSRTALRRFLFTALAAAGTLGTPAARAIVNPAGAFPGQNSDAADTRLDACGAFSFTTWLTGAPYLVGSGKALSGITLTGDDPVRVTVTAHGYSTGFDVIFQNIAGTTGLNGKVYRITVADTNTFTLNGTVSSQFAPYVSGGTSQQMTSQTDNWYGGAELIGPQVIVTAKHNLNNATDASQIAAHLYTVRFRRRTDGTVQYLSSDPGTGRIFPFSVKVRKWVTLPTYDIAIGLLEEPVTHIVPLSSEMTLPTVGRSIVLAGWGSYSQTQGSGSPRDGLRDSGSSPYKTVSSRGTSYVNWSQSFTKPMTSYAVNMHDSGGAVLGLSGTNFTYLGCITGYGSATGLNWANQTTNTFGKWLQGQVYTVTYQTDGTPGASLTGWLSQVVLNTGTQSCEAVSATAPAGWNFVQWTRDGTSVSTANPLTVSNVTQSMTLTAVFQKLVYPLTVNSGTGSGSYPTGATVSIAALAAPAGQVFNAWTGDTAALADPAAAGTTLTMPAAATAVTATYRTAIYTVNFQTDGTPGASLLGQTGQQVAHGAAAAPVEARAPDGWHFTNWTREESVFSTGNPLTVSNVTQALTLTARFAKKPGFGGCTASAGRGFTFSWSASGGLRYRVQYADGLPGGGYTNAFHDIVRTKEEEMAPFPPGTTGVLEFMDDGLQIGDPPNGARYYRIQVVPPDETI